MKNLAWKQITIALVIGFLLGGGFGLYQYNKKMPPWKRYSPEQMQSRMLEKYTQKLDLKDAQVEKLKVILAETQEDWKQFREEVRPQRAFIRDKMHQKVKAILSSDQLQRFDAMQADWEKKRSKWRHPGYPSGKRS